ncbi:MAG: hypothetical protein J6K03_00205, partial [Oscillospiraceae bacterium]|nr:hypothetical protein [Oscillospiraceae bacterium]
RHSLSQKSEIFASNCKGMIATDNHRDCQFAARSTTSKRKPRVWQSAANRNESLAGGKRTFIYCCRTGATIQQLHKIPISWLEKEIPKRAFQGTQNIVN